MKNEALLIIPAYNEENNLTKVLDSIEDEGVSDFADVLVMNDASSDATNWVARQHHVNVVTHVFNLGYGLGLQLGYKYAVRRGYKYVLQMDADGQHDISNIRVIYDELQCQDENGHYPDIVVGSRYMEGSTPYKTGFLRRFAIALFRKIIHLNTGQTITDPTSGLQGLSFPAFLYYSKYQNFDDKYPDANMLLQMLQLGFQVREIPAVMHTRTDGVSMHSGLKPILYMMRVTLSIFAVLYRDRFLNKGRGRNSIVRYKKGEDDN